MLAPLAAAIFAEGPGLEVECSMRAVAYDAALRTPMAAKHSAEIHASLDLDACSTFSSSRRKVASWVEPLSCSDGRHWASGCGAKAVKLTVYLDCESGSDARTGRTRAEAVRTAAHAQTLARTAASARILVVAGTCYVGSTLVLTEADSGVEWSSYRGAAVSFSGGKSLTRGGSPLVWRRDPAGIYAADLPGTVDADAVDGLFLLGRGGAAVSGSRRMVRARYPNGDPEVDRMPTNYDKLGGGAGASKSWEAAGNISKRFPKIRRNASFYPSFGRSNDVRWTLDWHTENASSLYRSTNTGDAAGESSTFWQSTVGTAAKWNETTFSPRVGSWTEIGDVVLHVMHYDWWGNWQWRLDDHLGVVPETRTFNFGAGGWQDAHGGPVIHNYFYAENVLAELDAPGEWYVSKRNRKVYFWPPVGSDPDWQSRLVVSQLSTIVSLAGRSAATPVTNVSFSGITFAHTTTNFVKHKYAVPSAGDWSVLPLGAVTLSNATHIAIRGSTFGYLGGNAIALDGLVHHSIISDCDFLRLGDSGVVSVGRLPAQTPYDGSKAPYSYPINVTVARSHFGGFGVFGKQTSALFVAVSKRITFEHNVLYDGPRAGININDGFGGGHVLRSNVIFNQRTSDTSLLRSVFAPLATCAAYTAHV